MLRQQTSQDIIKKLLCGVLDAVAVVGAFAVCTAVFGVIHGFCFRKVVIDLLVFRLALLLSSGL